MLYIIIGLIIIGIVVGVLEFIIGIVVGVLEFIIDTIRGVGRFVSNGISDAGKYVGNQIKAHDAAKVMEKKYEYDTAKMSIEQENTMLLIKELQQNCLWLGYMDEQSWREKLPNFTSRMYQNTTFEKITENFAKQIEEQNITHNDDWFEPFIQYVIAHPSGCTVTKMLYEVDCPKLHMTHIHKDGDLLTTLMERRTKAISKDVPALFSSTYIKEINENLYTPTKYLLHLYNREQTVDANSYTKEINFDELES